jgi:cytochrome c-type biogenesis protein CcmH
MPSAPLFWLVALFLVAATVAALVWPLVRGRGAPPVEPDNVAPTDVYRDQKRQLGAELAAGAITRDEHDAGVDELAARLGAELATAAPCAAAASGARAPFVAALVLAAALPLAALALYALFGHPDAMRSSASADVRAPQSQADIVAMVDKLAARMKEHPEDPTGWTLLARAYLAMGRYDDAVAAFTEASHRSTRDDASLLADWADALAMKNQSLDGAPTELVERALAAEPSNAKALALSASAAFERKDFDKAIAQWRTLEAQFPPGGAEAKEIATMIAQTVAAKGGATAALPAAPTPPAAVEAATAQAAITGTVTLDPALRGKLSADDTLYIFARATNGPRMPLAVVRAKASELPRAFRLDDSMAMTKDARLSTTPAVTVEARVSRTGSATPSAGDLQGKSASLKPGAHDVLIVINDVVR